MVFLEFFIKSDTFLFCTVYQDEIIHSDAAEHYALVRSFLRNEENKGESLRV